MVESVRACTHSESWRERSCYAVGKADLSDATMLSDWSVDCKCINLVLVLVYIAPVCQTDFRSDAMWHCSGS